MTKEFVKKFWILMPKEAAATSEAITKLFQKMGIDQSTYEMGKTKVAIIECALYDVIALMCVW